MTEFGMRHTTTYLTRCDLCGATNQHFYPATIGGVSFKFCSGSHLQRAKANYEAKETKKEAVFQKEEDHGTPEPGD